MKFLFDIIHPANVHYFKGVIKNLQGEGHEVVITARDKDLVYELLQLTGLEFHPMGKMGRSTLSKLWFFFQLEIRMFGLIRRTKPDVVVSFGSFVCAHASWLNRVPHIAFDDTEHASANRRLYKPFSRRIFSPRSYALDLGPKHYIFKAYMELFYLHPNQFERWRCALKEPFDRHDFAILRVIAWDAHHDVGQRGISFEQLDEIIQVLEPEMRVLLTIEGELPARYAEYRLPTGPDEIHSYMKEARLYIGEGATSATECGMLGTPSIYLNPLVPGYINDLEQHGLLRKFEVGERLSAQVKELLQDTDFFEGVEERSKTLVSSCIDPTAFFTWYFSTYPTSDAELDMNPSYQDAF